MNCVAIVQTAKKMNLFFGASLKICVPSIIGTPKIIHSQPKTTVKASIRTMPIIRVISFALLSHTIIANSPARRVKKMFRFRIAAKTVQTVSEFRMLFS